MRGVVGWCLWLAAVCVGCGGDEAGSEPDADESGDCARGCTFGAPCELSRESECQFAEPTSWELFDVEVGEALFPEPGARTELLAFPTRYAGKVAPIRLNEGVFDSRFVHSFQQEWSPDGQMLAFEAATAFVSNLPDHESGLFVSEFGAGVPGPARRVEGSIGGPGVQLRLKAWDPLSRGFLAMSADELYLVQREGSALIPSHVASAGIRDAAVCRGAEHVAYTTHDREFLLKSAAGDDTWRVEEGVDAMAVSSDAAWVVVTTIAADEARYTVELAPCGDGPRTTLLADREYAFVLGFSPGSRYLVLSDPEGYVDLADPSQLRPFPDGTNFVAWSRDDSFALLQTNDEVITFWPETGESVAVAAFSRSFRMLGDFLFFHTHDDRGQRVSFELLDPRTPGAVAAVYSAEEGSVITSVQIDASGTRLAYIEQAADASRAIVVDLLTRRELARFELHGVRELALRPFAADRSGIAALATVDEFSVFFLRVGATVEQNEVALVRQGQAGRWLNAQPFPSARER